MKFRTTQRGCPLLISNRAYPSDHLMSKKRRSRRPMARILPWAALLAISVAQETNNYESNRDLWDAPEAGPWIIVAGLITLALFALPFLCWKRLHKRSPRLFRGAFPFRSILNVQCGHQQVLFRQAIQSAIASKQVYKLPPAEVTEARPTHRLQVFFVFEYKQRV